MKKQKRKTSRNRKDRAVPFVQSVRQTTPRRTARSRRDFLKKFAFYAFGAGLAGGGGWYIVSDVQAGIAEQDLSLLGNGIPTVVQIHDPQCPRCRALQRETRKAVSQFEDGTIQYLVADIRQSKGRRLAAEHGVGHITLLLFDGSGRRRSILAGERRSNVLVREFRKLIRMSGKQ